MVIEDPPTIHLAVFRPPYCSATLIMDRVGKNLMTKDAVIKMQNDAATDYWQLGCAIARKEVSVDYKYVIVMIGLDWCLSVKKSMVREGLKRLVYGI